MLGLPSLAQAMWQVLVCVFAGFCAYCTFDVWHVTCDVWRVTCDVWRVTFDVWRVACDV